MSRAADADRAEMLHMASELLAEVRWGQRGFLDRLAEMSGGYPSSGGGSGAPSQSDPTGKHVGSRRDPAAAELAGFDREVRRVYADVLGLHARFARLCAPIPGRAVSSDPGCDLCDQVEGHWCPRYSTIEVAEMRKRGEVKRRVGVCEWCYRRWRRLGRLPSIVERTAHAEGRKVRESA